MLVDVVLVEDVDVVDEVDVVLVEVDVVVPGSPSGAQSSLGALGVTMRDPNWSFTMTGARAAFRHLSL